MDCDVDALGLDHSVLPGYAVADLAVELGILVLLHYPEQQFTFHCIQHAGVHRIAVPHVHR